MQQNMRWTMTFAVTALVGSIVVLYVIERSRRKKLEDGSEKESLPPDYSPPNALKFVKKLKNSPLPKAIVPEFESSAIRSWRLAYRRYRLGGEHGATGEAEVLLEHNQSEEQKKNKAMTQDIGEEVSSSKAEEGSWDEVEQTQKLITEYRLAYRRHRMGSR
jgi:hypothetical protein